MTKSRFEDFELNELMFYKDSLEVLNEEMTCQLDTLKTVKERFEQSAVSLLRLEDVLRSPSGLSGEALVPLTRQVYVAGRPLQPDKVIVGIGSDYLVDMTTSAAVDYFQRMLDMTSEVKDVLIHKLAVNSIGLDKIAQIHASKFFNRKIPPSKKPKVDEVSV